MKNKERHNIGSNSAFLCLLSYLVLITTSSCTLYRAVRYGKPDIYDYKLFVQDTVRRGDTVFEFKQYSYPVNTLENQIWIIDGEQTTLSKFFEKEKGDSGVIIIVNDTIVYEHYKGRLNRNSLTNTFSISKSITAMLCAIAIEEGEIESIDDCVLKYIPELGKADPLFAELTIRHLLDMRTGFDFDENYGINPFSQISRQYYGRNQIKQIVGIKFKETPGLSHYYNSMASSILGIVIERAAKRSYANCLQEKLWKAIGVENDAYVSLDDKKHRVAKSYGGVSASIIDLAKIGRLYLNRGMWNGHQIIPAEWIRETIERKKDNDHYSLGWWQSPNSEAFYAAGIYGQIIYLNPKKNIIIVRVGQSQQADYWKIFDALSDYL